ncbi:MAG TPA: transposase [Candidatus Chromulinivoraceae bacterium]|nr:transposase [Candidatus Chromulinivoraceae bacterium]
MSRKLTDDVIASRMVELRNLRKLHVRDRRQIAELKAENKVIRAENVELRQLLAQALEKIDAQAIQIAELQTMVFGKKKRPPAGGTPAVTPTLFALPKQPRSKDSYRRPLPPASAVTQEVALPLPATCACGGHFNPNKTTIHERYEEDIPLPELTRDYQPQLVTKYLIERGECLACGRAATGGNKDLSGQAVTLGSNTRLLVCHLISVVGLSYAQTTGLLLSLYNLTVTDGEIAHILQKQHQTWLPAYTQLKSDIRAAPVVHADETPWPIQDQQGHGYAWNLCDGTSAKVYFALEQSRGATYAHTLFGEDSDQPFAGVRITDDYAAYRSESLPGTQQLCWAHLYRTIRDLRYNAHLPEEQLPYVELWYASFAGIYQDLRTYLNEPYDEVVREQQAETLWQRVQRLANQPAPEGAGEPQKLTRLKAQLKRAGKDRLFVCLLKDTPCDNNRTERDLRQLVLKRKRSFGSKSERGAQALATVLSLCTTTWRTAPQGYFKALAQLGQ